MKDRHDILGSLVGDSDLHLNKPPGPGKTSPEYESGLKGLRKGASGNKPGIVPKSSQTNRRLIAVTASFDSSVQIFIFIPACIHAQRATL